jgi:hypothetical protein
MEVLKLDDFLNEITAEEFSGTQLELASIAIDW